jgi:hypothetical protein
LLGQREPACRGRRQGSRSGPAPASFQRNRSFPWPRAQPPLYGHLSGPERPFKLDGFRERRHFGFGHMTGGARSWSRKPSVWCTSASPCSLALRETPKSANSHLCLPKTLRGRADACVCCACTHTNRSGYSAFLVTAPARAGLVTAPAREGAVMASIRRRCSSCSGVSSFSSSTTSATRRFSAKARLATRDEAS